MLRADFKANYIAECCVAKFVYAYGIFTRVCAIPQMLNPRP